MKVIHFTYLYKINMLTVIFLTLVCFSNGVVFGRFIKASNNYDADICEDDCNSTIYCIGKDRKTGEFTFLHDVQMSGLYQDGTEFVKKKMMFSEEEILEKYAAIKRNKKKNELTQVDLKTFIEENFKNESLLKSEDGILKDFKQNPNEIKIMNKINPFFRTWLIKLNLLWKEFARKMNDENFDSNLSSYIYVPNTFIVAGGRFDEMYYWDSYWIIKGLLACEMYETTRGIVENFIHLVKAYGYVPNGNRRYYIKRSQPPMLIQMANAYYEATNDTDFIRQNLEWFETEFDWWYNSRRVQVKDKNGSCCYQLFRYHAIGCSPRPESYKEDYEMLMKYEPQDKDEEIRIYTGVRSAAESGWDFSSRHMREPAYSTDNTKGLTNMNPGEYAYVELNSIIYSNVKLLAKWICNRTLANKRNTREGRDCNFYEKFANEMLNSIENVLWNEDEGIWLDYDLINKKHRNFFYASNLAPLWSKTYINNPGKVDRTIDYLQRNKIINKDLTSKYYGVPTSDSIRNDSMQQWDFPNVWAPLQSFIIKGLQESNNPRAKQVALNLATAFVNTTYVTYCQKNYMCEKYDATKLGGEGGKGEYKSVTGFGWTNGFIFELFTMFPFIDISPTPKCKNMTQDNIASENDLI